MAHAQVDENDILIEPIGMGGYPIRISPPGTSKYHRINYRIDGKRFSTSAGATFTEAMARVTEIIDVIDKGTIHSGQPFSVLWEKWMDPDRPRQRKWSDSYRTGLEFLGTSYFLPIIGKTTCLDLRGYHLQRIIDKAPSQSEAKRLRRVLHTILVYGHGVGYLEEPPERLLVNVHYRGDDTVNETVEQGEDEMRVKAEAIPSHQAVEDMRQAMLALKAADPHDALMIVLAAYSGLRLGEILELRASDVNTTARQIHVRRQWNEPKSSKGQVTLPKWSKIRTTIYPAVTPAGYNLADAVRHRVQAVSKTNPEGLLFPAPRGQDKQWARRSYYTHRFNPAYKAAGWPTVPQRRNRRDRKPQPATSKLWTFHSLRHVFCTWLLWDRKASPADVARVAGHSNPMITLRIYASDAPGALDRLSDITA